jgi:hypothetical protein
MVRREIMGSWRKSIRLHGRLLILVAAFLLIPVVSWAGGEDPIRAAWMSTDFQVINLALEVQPIQAHFIAPDGTVVHTFTDTLAGGGSKFYTMTEALPLDFTGTVLLETPIRAAMAIVHLDEPEQPGGSTVFAGVADEVLGQSGYMPIHRCVVLNVHALNPYTVTNIVLDVFALDGTPQGTLVRSIPPQGVVGIYPLINLGLPFDFVGSGVLQADRPVEINVRDICGGISSFVAPNRGDHELVTPRLLREIPGEVTVTLSIQNTSAVFATDGEVRYSSGLTQTFSLPPLGMVILRSPFTNTNGNAVIVADRPVVGVVRTVSTIPNARGAHVYPAFAPFEATKAIALPVLFSGYEGWETGDRIWVRNLGPLTTTIRARYVTAPTGTVVWDQGSAGPGQVFQFNLPDLPAERAAAILVADQPIVALTGAFNSDPSGNDEDREIRYRGTNFAFNCTPVIGADFHWEPLTPVVSETVTFTGMAWGFSPGWLTTTVDSAGNVGQHSSLALDWAGRSHVAYVDDAQATLKYAFYDGAAWQIHVVDSGAAITGTVSLALGWAGLPHISYHAAGNLNYAFYDGVGWITEVVYLPGDAGVYNSLALDSNGHPHISFYVNGELRYAHHWNTGWNVEVVDSGGMVGHYNSLALDGSDRPHISYCDWNSFDLKYAWFDGTSWFSETVDAADAVCEYGSLRLDQAGRPHISYYARTDWDLKYAYYGSSSGTACSFSEAETADGGNSNKVGTASCFGPAETADAWQVQVIDGPDHVGKHSSLSLDRDDRPHISYYDESNGNLKYAWYDGISWFSETVEASGNVGLWTSLQLDGTGRPHISYYDATSADLDYAWLQRSFPTQPLSYTWDLGEGSSAEGLTIGHAYTLPGVYTVSLTVPNCLEFGLGTATYTLTVSLPSWEVYLPVVLRNSQP